MVTAICRKNFGCSHLIVGPDHTGVGEFYPTGAVEALFDRVGDIGIGSIFFGEVAFDSQQNRYLELAAGVDETGLWKISGSSIREYISEGKSPPEWMMRPAVSEALLEIRSKGRPVFEP